MPRRIGEVALTRLVVCLGQAAAKERLGLRLKRMPVEGGAQRSASQHVAASLATGFLEPVLLDAGQQLAPEVPVVADAFDHGEDGVVSPGHGRRVVRRATDRPVEVLEQQPAAGRRERTIRSTAPPEPSHDTTERAWARSNDVSGSGSAMRSCRRTSMTSEANGSTCGTSISVART